MGRVTNASSKPLRLAAKQRANIPHNGMRRKPSRPRRYESNNLVPKPCKLRCIFGQTERGTFHRDEKEASFGGEDGTAFL